MGPILDTVVGFASLFAGIGIVAAVAYALWRRHKRNSLVELLKRHFKPARLDRLAIMTRRFPTHMRADLQLAVKDVVGQSTEHHFTGVQPDGMEGVEFSSLLNEKLIDSTHTTPPEYEEIDVGEDQPISSLVTGLWLLERNRTKFAILYSATREFGACGITESMRVQVVVPNDERGKVLANQIFRDVESAVQKARSYRGKILSLEGDNSYLRHARGVRVHRLGKLARDQVILPAKTLELLDRNVLDFVEHRASLNRIQMATKKGLLFYGPPGTGKTHTIRYLAGALEGHTTLIMAAEQVQLLAEYMTLARLLQPSLVVIEDVDLIARDRGAIQDPRAEALLNKLLNEMDGLKEDCEVLFILTTNRPEQLEAALASRPGRIDQAVEFPLPDADGRAKLVRLYAQGLAVNDEVVQDTVQRTQNVSASFIKELLRRAAQYHLQRNGSETLAIADVHSALDEMLFSGGALNLKLLEAWTESETASSIL